MSSKGDYRTLGKLKELQQKKPKEETEELYEDDETTMFFDEYIDKE